MKNTARPRGFGDLKFKTRHEADGSITEYARLYFENGYGVSVIKGRGTYGGQFGLYEAAVIRRKGSGFVLVYTTSVTYDVIGWSDADEVTDIMEKIQNLPAENTIPPIERRNNSQHGLAEK